MVNVESIGGMVVTIIIFFLGMLLLAIGVGVGLKSYGKYASKKSDKWNFIVQLVLAIFLIVIGGLLVKPVILYYING